MGWFHVKCKIEKNYGKVNLNKEQTAIQIEGQNIKDSPQLKEDKTEKVPLGVGN